jgi:Domain of unknown function (DUF4359)
MKQWQIVLLGMLATLGVGGLMALTNPELGAYEEYAVEQLGNQAREKCDLAPSGLGVLFQGTCQVAVDNFKPQLRTLVSESSNRQNLVFFSIYRSDLSIPVVNLGIKVESIGMFNHFFTYKLN